MTMWRIGLVLALALACVPASGYIRAKAGTTPLAWANPDSIIYRIDSSMAAGAKNDDDTYMIVPGSDPAAAVQASFDAWNGVASSRARFAPLQQGAGNLGRNDGANVIGFAATASARSAVSDAIAVTITYFNVRTGEIVDADIILNPIYTFASKLALDAFDIQSTVTHELGHGLGADHSPLPSATMYPYGVPECTLERTLSADEIAFITEAYPAKSVDPESAQITGHITCPDGSCHPFPSVMLMDAAKGALMQTVGTSAGDYSFGRVPPGTYYVLVEPYIAPGQWFEDIQPTWGSAIYGGAQTPQQIEVGAGGVATANIITQPSTLLTQYFSLGSGIASGPAVHSGYPSSFLLYTKGLVENLRAEDILILGNGLSVVPDSIDFYSGEDVSDVYFDVDIASSATRTTSVIAIRQGDAIIFAPGITITPDVPAVSPSDVRNAADYVPGPFAPGEMIAIVGYRLGPVEGVSPGDLHAPGIAVYVDDVEAPVLYGEDRFLRIQVPYEIAGRESVVLRIRNGDTSAEEILAPVRPAMPGVMYVLNEDGIMNGSATPAARGSVLAIYGTGQGAVDPPLATGQKTPGDNPSLIPEVAVDIGGTPAVVKAAYMVPGSIGVFRIDVEVPSSVKSSSYIPLELSIAKVQSQLVRDTVAIR